MTRVAKTSTATSVPDEQSVTASLTAEIMHDLDDGRPTLVASTQGNQGDLQEVTPRQLLAKVTEARAQLDQVESLANEYAATVVIPAFVEHYGITLRETSLDGLRAIDPELAAIFRGSAALLKDGELIVTVPEGLDPVARLSALRDLVLDQQKRAVQA
ncbi:hypothetical protein [Streptomyces sp. 2A115]|uniref:hypothetical protein n=1 Tax=Streptomyces sp. 2A115 TaxID=3457439 RepID=UPI003FD542B3